MTRRSLDDEQGAVYHMWEQDQRRKREEQARAEEEGFGRGVFCPCCGRSVPNTFENTESLYRNDRCAQCQEQFLAGELPWQQTRPSKNEGRFEGEADDD